MASVYGGMPRSQIEKLLIEKKKREMIAAA